MARCFNLRPMGTKLDDTLGDELLFAFQAGCNNARLIVLSHWVKVEWRREGDSNPRYGFTRTTV